MKFPAKKLIFKKRVVKIVNVLIYYRKFYN